MDELMKTLIVTSPIGFVLLYLGKTLIDVLSVELAKADKKRDQIMERLTAIEKKIGIEPPTGGWPIEF